MEQPWSTLQNFHHCSRNRPIHGEEHDRVLERMQIVWQLWHCKMRCVAKVLGIGSILLCRREGAEFEVAHMPTSKWHTCLSKRSWMSSRTHFTNNSGRRSGKAQLDQWSSLYGSVVTDNWRELSKPSSLGHSGCESPPLRNQLRLVSIGSSDSSPPSREHCCNLLPSPGTSGRPEVLPFCTRSCSLTKAIPRSCSRSVGNYSIPASSFF